jgi:ATP-grasp domain/Carbamoyl-phosphate synthase L chain, ATP binding domain
MTRKVLLATTTGWLTIARHAGGFARAACAVDVFSPPHIPALASRYFTKRFVYSPFAPLSSLRSAIGESAHDLIVPCDDRATAHLLRLYQTQCSARGGNGPVADLIRRSLGSPENYANLMSRGVFIAAVRAMDVRAPESSSITNENELADRISAIGFPAVLKTDGSWGGDGIAIVRNLAEAKDAFRKLKGPPSRLRSVARAVRRRDMHHLMTALAPSPRTVSVQQFIPGHPAASAFACWEGRVVAAIYYDVLKARSAIGPPHVIQRVDCAEMAEATRRIARRFSLSGLHGIDFIRDAAGTPHVIELNPRATQGGTLHFGKGCDLPAALASCLGPGDVPVRKAMPSDAVVFFPSEWQSDPASPYLAYAYHDVPWDDPAILRAGLGLPVHVLKADAQLAASPASDSRRAARLAASARHTS